jgi:hypothetical protein
MVDQCVLLLANVAVLQVLGVALFVLLGRRREKVGCREDRLPAEGPNSGFSQHLVVAADPVAPGNFEVQATGGGIGVVHLRNGQMETLAIRFRESIEDGTVSSDMLQGLSRGAQPC